MKQGVLAAIGALAMILTFQPQTAAVPLILSKDASGHIIPSAVSLELRSSPVCDQTQNLIPDGSKLVGERFILNVDDKGIGFFHGIVRIITPEGKSVIAGLLHGTVGFTAGVTDTTRGCYSPGHLEGMLSGAVLPQPVTSAIVADQASVVTAPLEINFQADIVPESAGIVPLYRARLAGLVPPPVTPPPTPPKVLITPSKLEYNTTEPVVAVIVNRSTQDIQVFDGNSYCSIVQLQRQVGTDWQMVGGCMLTVMPRPHVIKAGTILKVSLPEVATPEFTHEPGTYRMVIDWQTVDSSGTTGELTRAISPLFKIVKPTPPVPQLTVAPDKLIYNPIDTITAIIVNGPVPVRIFDEQSICTIVQMQRAEGTDWVLVAPCAMDRIPIATILAAGETKKVELTRNATWTPGRYRLAVTFEPVDSTTSTDPTVSEVTVYSLPFAVVAPPPTPIVTLTTDKKAYGLADPIVATIANNSTVDVMTWDHQSFCTVIDMQGIQSDGTWKSIAPCPLMTPTIPVIIKAGTTMVVTLHGIAATDVIKWDAGTYRLHLTYGVPNNTGAPSVLTDVYTDPFAVGMSIIGITAVTPEYAPFNLR